ncbi:DUF4389 domain-containing protein [Nocardioides panaciterrulae]|uniref:DUF4389 domain-containing protein n=1 Tax=Nocardioides panaciterrulae TaxID=661492 RepID=A0A7Y9E8P4_9ACTN|nr:DUF4389 domain-containing protein [Nocardioides panaciterrulae]NYD43158.1 hypothetical protein [Nocardioides panaciterrulae]
MNGHVYPVRVDAALDPGLSRWLWLVKWLLAIPHYVVLAFLWAAFVVLSVVAWVAILVTGRYPRGIFDFNVGVLRWSWRVAFYAYGGLGTDRYPPFSLEERPDYPAHLEVEYPDHLSRGLALVKWWLLAIPHYLVVGVFLGAGWYAASGGDNRAWGSGLIGLLVLVAAVVLLFTGRYPGGIFDLVLGLNRWVLRVAAYASLMTDDYPPFRLDLGGTDPATGVLTVGGAGRPPSQPPTQTPPQAPTQAPTQATPPTTWPPAGPPAGPGAARLGTPPPGAGPGPVVHPQVGAAAPPPTVGWGQVLGGPPTPPPPPVAAPSRWGPGRILAVVVGSVLALVSLGLVAAGGVLRVADDGLRDDRGYLMSSAVAFTSPGYAVTSPDVELRSGTPLFGVPDDWLGTVRVEADGRTGNGVFVGIARTNDVDTYLAGVAHSVVREPYADGGSARTDFTDGGSPPRAPQDLGFWAASSHGPGRQTVTWPAEAGHWTLVVMNGAGTTPVAADVAVGATVPALDNLAWGLLVTGLVGAIVAAVVLVLALRRRPPSSGPQDGPGMARMGDAPR